MNMKKLLSMLLVLLGVLNLTAKDVNVPLNVTSARQKYEHMQRSIAKGWNTWDTRSVLRHVLLPYGVAIDISLVSPDGKRVDNFFIGDRKGGAPQLHPAAHSYDGYYTDISVAWKNMSLRVESAADGMSNVIMITPKEGNVAGGKVVVSLKSLWKRANTTSTSDNKFSMKWWADSKKLSGEVLGDFIENRRGEIVMSSDKPVAICCGTSDLDYAGARNWVDGHMESFTSANKKKYGSCYDEYNAVQSALGWDNIYDPTINKVITPVSRIWNMRWSNNEQLGGFVLFCWDSYFASMMFSTDNKELAYANAVEMTSSITEQGFVPNFFTENNYKTRDRSQPPVGSMAAWLIYCKYKEKWFLELLYGDLIRWNRWWEANRKTDGLFCWGSAPFEPVTYRGYEFNGVNQRFGAALESGQDNSYMYDKVPFDKETHQLKLNDVGLSSLYIMDCNYLALIADELGQKKDAKELRRKSKMYSKNLTALWDEENEFYYNFRTDLKEFDYRPSPSNFYPMLAGVPTDEQAEAMLKRHLLNPEEFWGEYVIPATPRNAPAFKDNTYWRGRIWGPLNFLVYMGLRNYNTPAINDIRRQFSEKSKQLLLKSWKSHGYVFENYNATTGQGDDVGNSDKFYHWGALLGFINLIEQGLY